MNRLLQFTAALRLNVSAFSREKKKTMYITPSPNQGGNLLNGDDANFLFRRRMNETGEKIVLASSLIQVK